MSQQKGEHFITEDKKLQLSYSTEKAVVWTGAFSAYAVLNIAAPDIEDKEDGKRPKLVLTAVLDCSMSMSGDKMDLTKTAMHFITQQLHHQDLFGIVVYDDRVATQIELTQAHQKYKRFFKKKIDKISTDGCTNLSGGLLRGIDQQIQAKKNKKLDNTRSTIRAILLCTDGLANVGITHTQELARITKTNISDEQNLRVHTFGFGSDHDPVMLTEIADAGQGDFFYVESDDVIPEAFGNVLGGLLSVAAQNVRIKITPIQPSFRIMKIWDKVIDEKAEENGSTTISIRDLKSEGQRKLLFEYSLDKTDQEGVQDIAKISIKYFNVATESMDEVSCTLSVNRQNTLPNIQPTNPEISSNIARIQTTAAIHAATKYAENNNFLNAQKIIRGARDELFKLNISDKSQEKNLYQKLDSVEESCSNEFEYSTQGGRHVSYAVGYAMNSQSAVFKRMSSSVAPQPRKRGIIQSFSNFLGGGSAPPPFPPEQSEQACSSSVGPQPKKRGIIQSIYQSFNSFFGRGAAPLPSPPEQTEWAYMVSEEELAEEGMNKLQLKFQSKASSYSQNKTKK